MKQKMAKKETTTGRAKENKIEAHNGNETIFL